MLTFLMKSYKHIVCEPEFVYEKNWNEFYVSETVAG